MRRRPRRRNRRVVDAFDMLALQGMRHGARLAPDNGRSAACLEPSAYSAAACVGTRQRRLARGSRRERQHSARQASPCRVVNQSHQNVAPRKPKASNITACNAAARPGESDASTRVAPAHGESAARRYPAPIARHWCTPAMAARGLSTTALTTSTSICVGETLTSSRSRCAPRAQRRPETRPHRAPRPAELLRIAGQQLGDENGSLRRVVMRPRALRQHAAPSRRRPRATTAPAPCGHSCAPVAPRARRATGDRWRARRRDNSG